MQSILARKLFVASLFICLGIIVLQIVLLSHWQREVERSYYAPSVEWILSDRDSIVLSDGQVKKLPDGFQSVSRPSNGNHSWTVSHDTFDQGRSATVKFHLDRNVRNTDYFRMVDAHEQHALCERAGALLICQLANDLLQYIEQSDHSNVPIFACIHIFGAMDSGNTIDTSLVMIANLHRDEVLEFTTVSNQTGRYEEIAVQLLTDELHSPSDAFVDRCINFSYRES